MLPHFQAFEALNKAYKTLENGEGLKRCEEIVEEAKVRVQEMVRYTGLSKSEINP